MANQDLSKVTTVPTASINNVKTFLAVMNDGSIQQMTKADMASVLGELLGFNKVYKMRNYELKGNDTPDNEIEPGAVFMRASTYVGAPYNYCMISIDSTYIIGDFRLIRQTAIPMIESFTSMKYRIGQYSPNKVQWSDWKSINL